MEHARKANWFTSIDTERDDVLDLKIDRVAHSDAMPQPVIDHVDPSSLDAEHLTHQWSERRHRTAELPTKDLNQFFELLIRRLVVNEHTQAPVSLCHYFRSVRDHRHLATAYVCALYFTLPDIEHKANSAKVIRRSVEERQIARAHQVA